MKTCPYCSEQIQDEAIKCKHCGEWLNKTRPADVIGKIGGFFKAGKKYIEEHQAKRAEQRYSHLFVPTADTPFSYNDVHLYASHLQVGSTRIEFDEIFAIIFYSSSQSYNGIASNTNITFTICFSPGDRVNLYPENAHEASIAKGTFLPIGSKKDIERIQFMFQLLEKFTVKYRLIRYVNEIKKKGFFNYIGSAEVYNNGDLKLKDGKIVNIKTAYDNGLVSFGTKFSGLKSSSYDPFAFTIYPSQGLKVRVFGFDLNSKIEINTIWNKDCFEAIVEQIVTKGKVVEMS